MRLLRQTTLLAALALASIAALGASSASAAEYEVAICTHTADTGLSVGDDAQGSSGIETSKACGPGPGFGGMLQGVKGQTPRGGKHWTLTAPPGTLIHTLAFEAEFAGWNSEFHYLMTDAENSLLLASFGPAPGNGGRLVMPDSKSVTSDLFCVSASCAPTGGAFVDPVVIQNIIAELTDLAAPTVAVDGAIAGSPLRDTATVSYTAKDSGSGVARTVLIVDDVEGQTATDTNGGKCQVPYINVVPCKLELQSTFPLDTTKLSEGQHEIKVAAIDASGQRTVSAPVSVDVQNSPANTTRPAISGTAKVGSTLGVSNGSWLGAPTTFAYQWLRCPGGTTDANIDPCSKISGASSAQYTLTSVDVGQRLLARVAAGNSVGSIVASSGLSEVVPAIPTDIGGGNGSGPGNGSAPKLSGLKLSPKRFRAGTKATLSLRSSEAAKLTITIEKLVPHRKAKRVGRLAPSVKAGSARIAFKGKIGAKPLSPGRYRMAISARDSAGHVSKPAQLSFTILP